MNTTEEVFFIILSVSVTMLCLFLIAAAVYVLGILKQVKKVTNRAEEVAESVESAADSVRAAASPIAAIKVIAKIVERAAGANKKRR